MDASAVLTEIERCGNLRRLMPYGHQGKFVTAGGKTMFNLSSNDYLGLASDVGLYRDFIEESGIGNVPPDGATIPENLLFSSSSSRLLTGNFSVCEEVERVLAELYGKEAALVFGSGYNMNSGIIPAITTSEDLILADKLVHASMIDGIRLSQAKTIRFPHQNLDRLEKLVDSNALSYDTIFILVESVYSMDGDVTDLTRLVSLKKRHSNVVLYVDEAHGFGVRGESGLGVVQEQNCIGDIDLLCGTFGKALASTGGFTVCSSGMREFLVNRMRPFIFTTAMPPVNLMWTLHVLKRLPSMTDRRRHLAGISARLRMAAAEEGFTSSSESHIIPIMAGESARALKMAERFREEGFFLLPVRPPTVPEGTSRIRISLTAAVSDEEADRLISSLRMMKSMVI